MVASLKNLKNEVDSRLAAGGLTDLACCQLQNAQTILDNNVVTTVANLASLPSPALNEGRFVYVDDINEYRFSTGETWSDDVSSTIAPYSRQIWTWGKNACGSIGDGTVAVSKCSPVREICSATDWCQVKSNVGGSTNMHMSALTTTGQLWSWGINSSCQLGIGNNISQCIPVREFCSATNWCQTSVGARHNSAIKTDGSLWAWGCNNCGQIGDNTLLTRSSPVREISSATNWCQVNAGWYRVNAIKTTGELWAWGNNTCGSLGNGLTTNTCSPVREFYSATDWCTASTGKEHMAAVKTNGSLWLWGRNFCGELGFGTLSVVCSPVQERCSATDWCMVSAGNCHTAAIKTTGQLWAWGTNFCTPIGDGTTVHRCSPVREFCSETSWCMVSSSTYFSTFALKTTGQLWAWGSNSCGSLGDGTATTRCSPVREHCSATNWCFVSVTAGIRANTKGFNEAP